MFVSDESTGSPALDQTAVEVEIWEGYLLKNRSNVARTLCTYSLDNGPLLEKSGGRLMFRFTAFDWEKKIEQLLTSNNIHFSIITKVGINPFEQLLKKKIYVADDDQDAAFALSAILEDAGYHVKVAACGKAILEGSFSWVDLFILDNKMPGLDGIQICRHLRSQSATKETPVILVSAYPKNGDEALLAGANDYIEKPFNMHYLLNVVMKYTRRP